MNVYCMWHLNYACSDRRYDIEDPVSNCQLIFKERLSPHHVYLSNV